jgi:hypothetical protein
MKHIFILALAFIVALGAALGVLLYVSLIPFFHEIGIAATILIMVGLGCAATFLIVGTYSQVGVMLSKRHHAKLHSRVVSVGDVVAVLDYQGNWTHLSAQHEAAKIQPLQLAPPKGGTIIEEVDYNIAQILEYWEEGQTLENIVEATGTPYNQVQKICRECANNNPEKLKRHNVNRSKLATKR